MIKRARQNDGSMRTPLLGHMHTCFSAKVDQVCQGHLGWSLPRDYGAGRGSAKVAKVVRYSMRRKKRRERKRPSLSLFSLMDTSPHLPTLAGGARTALFRGCRPPSTLATSLAALGEPVNHPVCGTRRRSPQGEGYEVVWSNHAKGARRAGTHPRRL